ncbi:unnamed protein product [Hymenolepis diminuta]|uniref:Ovule protein n=1 Tax=Hymenolepis diminuta TaxID=6216 RepID=A0A0R3SVP8_HYMDI|nr:unnamed protein product [Hymenolepis diminuta]VUZ53970.1 unnamed protein product [Hymenolepis diminuta]
MIVTPRPESNFPSPIVERYYFIEMYSHLLRLLSSTGTDTRLYLYLCLGLYLQFGVHHFCLILFLHYSSSFSFSYYYHYPFFFWRCCLCGFWIRHVG